MQQANIFNAPIDFAIRTRGNSDYVIFLKFIIIHWVKF